MGKLGIIEVFLSKCMEYDDDRCNIDIMGVLFLITLDEPVSTQNINISPLIAVVSS